MTVLNATSTPTDPYLGFGKIPKSIWLVTGWSGTIFFLCSTARHLLYQSTAWDLGIYDQTLYLISQNLPAIPTFLGFHILADHGAFIFYPLSLLYRLFPSVYWLFALQSTALALGVPLAWALAQQASLSRSLSWAIALSYSDPK